jgi:VCBS repeat-containing protein
MKRLVVVLGVALLAAPVVASAETWKNVSVIDTSCLAKVKADPDKHTKACALQCAKGGYGLLTEDGTYLKFDAAGNEKTVAALKATEKTDKLRATVVGKKDGEGIKVESVVIE